MVTDTEVRGLVDELRLLVAEFRQLVSAQRQAGSDTSRPDASATVDLVPAAVDRMGLLGIRNKLFTKLPRPLLLELCERLITPGVTVQAAHEWLLSRIDENLSDRPLYRLRSQLTPVIADLRGGGVREHGPSPEPSDETRTAMGRMKPPGSRNVLYNLSPGLQAKLCARLEAAGAAKAPTGSFPTVRRWLAAELGRSVNVRSFSSFVADFQRAMSSVRREQARQGASKEGGAGGGAPRSGGP